MTEINKKRLYIFLGIAFAISWVSALVIVLTGGLENSPVLVQGSNITLAVVLLSSIYMWGPALANILTRMITKEGWENLLVKPMLKESWLYWLLGWFGPGILSIIGMLVFFLLFPAYYDADMTILQAQLAAAGTDIEAVNLQSMIITQVLTALVISPLLNFTATFGEELGWRGYLLPKLESIGKRKALLFSSIIWGVWHWPVIWMGYNYGTEYWGYPWMGLLSMVWFTLSVGIFFGWLSQKGKSVWPAVVAHGALNGIASLGLLFIKESYPTLLGPTPVGIIGGLAFTLVSLVILLKTKD